MKIITELLFCVALYSFQPTHWVQEPSDLANNDLIAQGKKNIWICHVEDKKTIGDFQSFVQNAWRRILAFQETWRKGEVIHSLFSLLQEF